VGYFLLIRKIDALGRLVLPKEIRKDLGLDDGVGLEIFVDENHIYLRKHIDVCCVCDKTDDAWNMEMKYFCKRCNKKFFN